jgi:hypothetical protein
MDEAREAGAEAVADLAVELEAAADTPTGESEAAEDTCAEAREAARRIEPRGGEAL